MNAKQQRFVAEYLVDLNATQAAIRAGYTRKRADQAGHQLLRNPEIAQAVEAGQRKRLESAELSSVRILEELRRLALCDIRGLFTEQGNLKPIKDLTAEQGSVLSSIEVVQRNLTSGDGEVDTIHKVRLWDKPRALETLAKHFGLLTERLDLSGAVELKWKD